MKYCRHKWTIKTAEERLEEMMKDMNLRNATGSFVDVKTCNECLKEMWGFGGSWHTTKKGLTKDELTNRTNK